LGDVENAHDYNRNCQHEGADVAANGDRANAESGFVGGHLSIFLAICWRLTACLVLAFGFF